MEEKIAIVIPAYKCLPPADIGFYCRTDLSKFYCLHR